jgi:hypothetical protein
MVALREADERENRSDDVRREQSEIKRKPTREQNWSDDVLRTSGGNREEMPPGYSRKVPEI